MPGSHVLKLLNKFGNNSSKYLENRLANGISPRLNSKLFEKNYTINTLEKRIEKMEREINSLNSYKELVNITLGITLFSTISIFSTYGFFAFMYQIRD